MPFPIIVFLRYVLVPSGLCAVAVIPGPWLFAAEPVADNAGANQNQSQSEGRAEHPARCFTARDKSRSATVRDWSRSIHRPASGHATDSTAEPRIRFASASGAEDGDVATATASDEKSASLEIPPETKVPAAEPSLSVKEQLLNALKAQREATVGNTASPTKPGTLTILNPPRKKSEAVPETAHPPVAGPTETPATIATEPLIEVHTNSITSVLPAPTASDPNRSRVGLTRTLEADLLSDDPFIRERAQRYLHLEMQLLKLRASQAADAELPVPNTDRHDTDAHHVPTPVTEHHSDHTEIVASPPTPLPAVPDAEHHADSHSAHDEESDRTPDAAIMKNVIVDGPIDRLGLANNLFAVGQYPLALEMYQQASSEILAAHQQFWVEYQTANCIRRLGRPGEASQLYRKLAHKPEAGWLSEQAQWWIETLEKIRVLESVLANNSFERHRATVEEMELVEMPIEPPQAQKTADQAHNKEPQNNAHAH